MYIESNKLQSIYKYERNTNFNFRNGFVHYPLHATRYRSAVSGAIGFAAVAVGAIYGMGLALAARQPLHLVFGVVAVLMMLVNAKQAGFLPFFGKHPRVFKHGRNVGIVFAPFCLVVAILNYLAFSYATI